jgi:hypothetical protein
VLFPLATWISFSGVLPSDWDPNYDIPGDGPVWSLVNRDVSPYPSWVSITDLKIDSPTTDVTIDQVSPYFVRSDEFSLGVVEEGSVADKWTPADPGDLLEPALVEGYWLMLDGLSKGDYTLTWNVVADLYRTGSFQDLGSSTSPSETATSYTLHIHVA